MPKKRNAILISVFCLLVSLLLLIASQVGAESSSFESSPKPPSGVIGLTTPFLAENFIEANGEKILFLNYYHSIDDTGWSGFSNLAGYLRANGFIVEEKKIKNITKKKLSDYDIIVFGGIKNRTISFFEALAIKSFVKDGGGLLLAGNLGPWYYSKRLNKSLDKLGAFWGIKFRKDMVCHPTDHYIFSNDPDGGVDMPFIYPSCNHMALENVVQFSYNWGCSLSVEAPAHSIAAIDDISWRDRNSSWDDSSGHYNCIYNSNEYQGVSTVIAAVEAIGKRHGQGRIIAMGDADMWYNDWFDNFDNQQLAASIFNYLIPYTGPVSHTVSNASRACLDNSFGLKTNIRKACKNVKNKLKNVGFDAHYRACSADQLDFITDLELWDAYAVLVHSHGNNNDGGTIVFKNGNLTDEDIDGSELAPEGGVFFAAVCEGADEDDLGNAFLASGYDAFIGYPVTVKTLHNIKFYKKFFEKATQKNKSVSAALAETKNWAYNKIGTSWDDVASARIIGNGDEIYLGGKDPCYSPDTEVNVKALNMNLLITKVVDIHAYTLNTAQRNAVKIAEKAIEIQNIKEKYGPDLIIGMEEFVNFFRVSYKTDDTYLYGVDIDKITGEIIDVGELD